MNKAVFLDKDGTLIENVPYNVDPAKIKVYEDVPDALRLLAGAGFKLVIVTNQPGLALGYFEENSVFQVKNFLAHFFKVHTVKLDGFYYCPHFPEGKIKEFSQVCACRKPLPGLLIQASKELNIDLEQSWMVGDILNDVEAGKLAGCRSVLIDNGNETEWVKTETREPDFTVKNLLQAASIIIYEEDKKKPKDLKMPV